jgi:ribosomal protein L3
MGKQIKGILGTKLGMTQVFNDAGQIVPVTVVQAGPCVVTGVRTPDNDGYSAVQLGFGEIDPRKVTKPVSGMFSKAGLTPRRYIAELRTDDASEYTLGQEVTAEVFASGQHVDVTGRSKGKGNAGVMSGTASRASAPRTAPSASIARPVPSARAPPRGGCSRACAWRAGWAACAPRCSRSPCTPSTPSAGCS